MCSFDTDLDDADGGKPKKASHLRASAASIREEESTSCLWCLGILVGSLIIYLTLNEVFELQEVTEVKKHMLEVLHKVDEHFGEVSNTTQLVDPNGYLAPPAPDFDMSIEDFLGLNHDWAKAAVERAPPPPPVSKRLRGYNKDRKEWGYLHKDKSVLVNLPENPFTPPPPDLRDNTQRNRDVWEPIDNQWRAKATASDPLQRPGGVNPKTTEEMAEERAAAAAAGVGQRPHEVFGKLLAGKAGQCMIRSQPSAWQATWIASAANSEAAVRNAMMGAQRQAGRCAFLSKNCVKAGQRFSIGEGRATRWASPVDVENMPMTGGAGSLGSCAVVGPSQFLLNAKRGWEIDSHKTVVRVGHYTGGLPVTPPVHGFENFVGSRTDITFLAGEGGGKADVHRTRDDAVGLPRLYARQGWADPGCDRRTMCGSGQGQAAVANAGRTIFGQINRAFGGAAATPSGAFLAMLWFQSSGLCTSVDVYGIAGVQDGPPREAIPAYFEGGANATAEQARVEQYAMAASMRAGLACSYVDERPSQESQPGAISGSAVDGVSLE